MKANNIRKQMEVEFNKPSTAITQPYEFPGLKTEEAKVAAANRANRYDGHLPEGTDVAFEDGVYAVYLVEDRIGFLTQSTYIDAVKVAYSLLSDEALATIED